MRIRWTTNAANDLTRIVERMREDNPTATQRVAGTNLSFHCQTRLPEDV